MTNDQNLIAGCETCEHIADVRGIDLTETDAIEVVANVIHDLGCMSQVGLGEPHSDEVCGLRYDGDGDHLIAETVIAFIRDAIHRDGNDADAVRETLGLRDQCRHLCTCGGDWGGFSHTMSDRHEPRAPERRVVGEWQEVQS